MTPKQEAYQAQAATIIKNLAIRGMEGYYFEDSKSCLQKILEIIPKDSVVSNGGTMTAEEIGLMDAVKKGSYTYIDRLAGKTPEEKRLLHSEVVKSDYYIMSTNALTLDGELVNIDGIGNRVACLAHGPKYVIIVAGMNKIVPNISAGIDRTINFAAPPNAKRLNRQTPCNVTGKCGDCFSPDCMCSQIVVTRRNASEGRIKVFLIGEVLGY